MITAKQRLIIDAVKSPTCRKDLSPLVGIYGSEMTHLLSVLLDKGYITFDTPTGNKSRYYEQTPLGIRALKHKVDFVAGNTAQPNRINVFALPEYHTPQSYARNDGNVHIASRGF